MELNVHRCIFERNPEYKRVTYKVQIPPIGTRENPSNAKPEMEICFMSQIQQNGLRRRK